MRTEMAKNESGLWVPTSFAFNRHHGSKQVRTVILPDSVARYLGRPLGTKAKVTVCDARTTKHVETDEGIDAFARPKSVQVKVRSIQ